MEDQLREERWQKIGMTWIHAIAEHDFQQLSRVCQANVSGRLVLPGEVDRCENINGLIASIQDWFGNTSHTQVEYARVDQVGRKLAINYRIIFQQEDREWVTAEQQVYGYLSDGLIARLDLLCSGFQPLPGRVDIHEDNQAELRQDKDPSIESVLPAADAVLVFNTKSGAQGPTCSVLTPAIKSRLSELRSGQVLEVRVDDPEAKGDIESWCRLSGNELLAMTTPEQPPEERGNLWFYLKKK